MLWTMVSFPWVTSISVLRLDVSSIETAPVTGIVIMDDFPGARTDMIKPVVT
jgi:hypothetical protein